MWSPAACVQHSRAGLRYAGNAASVGPLATAAVSGQSYSRGRLAPSPAPRQYQSSGFSLPARRSAVVSSSDPPPSLRLPLLWTASTCGCWRACSMRRGRRSAPYSASPKTKAPGSPGIECGGDQSARDLQFGFECYVFRHRGPPPARLVLFCPGLRKVEPPVDQCMTPAACVRQEPPDLTILDRAGGAGILPCHADRVFTLLEETGLVDHQHAVAQAVCVPVAGAEQRLHPIRLLLRTSPFRQQPAGLPLDPGRHTVEKGAVGLLRPAVAQRPGPGDPSTAPILLRRQQAPRPRCNSH